MIYYPNKRLLKPELEVVAVQNSVESVAWNHLTWPVIILAFKCQIILNDTLHSSSKRNWIQLVKRAAKDLVLSGPKNNNLYNYNQNCLIQIININIFTITIFSFVHYTLSFKKIIMFSLLYQVDEVISNIVTPFATQVDFTSRFMLESALLHHQWWSIILSL